MVQNIPVPAEVVRQMAIEASDQIPMHRRAGRKNTARTLEEDVSTALEALDGKDGEFVSLNAMVVSSLAAESAGRISEEYSDSARVFLEQYGIWGKRASE